MSSAGHADSEAFVELGLDDRVALVTGSYRGTGAGIARVLAQEGATVLVHGLEPGQADEVSGTLAREGYDVHPVCGDIRTDEGADAVARLAAEVTGPVDVLVNNYGTAEGGGWLDGPLSDWHHMYEVNVLSGVRMVQRLVPAMKEQGWGRVLFLSTVGNARPRAQMPGYYASKTALLNMAISLSKDLAGTGITVNTVSPGIIATAEVKESLMRRARKAGHEGTWEEIHQFAAREFMPNVAGRIGTVDDVGQLVAFLSSDLAGYVTGANIRIDGGAADCL